jgi:hypothetical protein
MTLQSIPKPDERGTRCMPDGSLIYTSGGDYERDGVKVTMHNIGKFMLWLKTGTVISGGVARDTGEFVMDNHGPKYFPRVIDAYSYWQELKGKS